MVLSLYIYIYMQNIFLSPSDYTTTKYSGMVRYVALCWRGMLSQPYMNPMGSFVVDWLINLCCQYPAPNLVKPSFLNPPRLLKPSVLVPPKKNTTHTSPTYPNSTNPRKKTSPEQTTKNTATNQPPLIPTPPIAILYHPKTRTMSLAESRSNLGFSPPRWLVERTQFEEGCCRWVFLKNSFRLKRHFCKFWYGNQNTYRWTI